MNCTQIERLIPLYIGGDLPAVDETAVHNHLASCEQCAGIAGEFKESRDWLRGFTPPQFDQPVLDDLRDQVMTKIARVQTRPSLLDLLLPAWKIRIVLAGSTALILLIAGLLVFLNSQRLTEQHPITGKGPTPDPEDKQKQHPSDITKTEPNPQKRGQKSKANHHSPRGPATTETKLPILNISNIEEYLDIWRREITFPFHSDIARIPDINENEDREMLKIEIQTADPNIRIIWFIPVENTSSASKH
ncbi:MAG: zf-HC2 domain-containing protein [Acidobacteria bacterium]|nr:zf-HC2 domain-containing protein [Acidobacteriota bacterium]